jgi:hypothetical protein
MDEARTMTATFERKLVLTVDRVGVGHGRVTSQIDLTGHNEQIFCGTTCSMGFDRDSIVQLLAEPEYDSYFVEWTGECAHQTNNTGCMVIMNDDKATTARFALKPVLTVTVSGNGTVRSPEGRIVCPGPCDSQYEPGQTVTLTAAPGQGETFLGWGGACSGLALTCDVTLQSARQVSASFSQTGGGSGGGGGSGDGSGGGGGGGGSQDLIGLLLLSLLPLRKRGVRRSVR